MSTRKDKRQIPAAGVNQLTSWPVLMQKIQADQISIDQLMQLAEAFVQAGNVQQAETAYKLWIQHSSSPMKFVACFNLGVMLGANNHDDEAIKYYRLALQINPKFGHPRINMGLAYERKGQPEEAVREWQQIEEDPILRDQNPVEIRTTALNHIGRLRESQRNFLEAEKALTKSLTVNPAQKDALHHWFHLRQKQCEWPLEREVGEVSKNLAVKSMSPLACLAYEDSLAFQMYTADRIVKEKFTWNHPAISERKPYGHQRVRIGYLSGDLCTHAVGLLLPEIFELHDRNRFEIFAYDYSREDGTLLRHRIKSSIEHFTSIAHLTDQQAAVKIRTDEIDILIDLHGLSLGVRAEILAYRPAPIQMTYLGYIGTTMMPYIDYVITDRYCFTEKAEIYYSEKPLMLDHACLPMDRKKQVDAPPSRAACGLPEDKFVFATFNNAYKLNEKMFKSWLNIMKAVPNSVLWIVDDNPWATANLRSFTERNGVDPTRLIFTTRVTPSQYLARMQVVDLFLDNHPYNAGSTASDIIWMGTPMITLSGETFVSRMAGSLLHHAGLSALIAHSHEQYEQLAVALAQNPQMLSQIRQIIQRQKEPGGAFDMARFTANLEEKYLETINKLAN